MALELLIGVMHRNESLSLVEREIEKRFPQGIESIMLELPDRDHFDNFFSVLREKYESKARIIFGDPKHPHPKWAQKLAKNLVNNLVNKSGKDFYSIINYASNKELLGLFLLGIVDAYIFLSGIINREKRFQRNKAIVDKIREEKPQVVVVGQAHANHIRRFFNVPYIAICKKSEDQRNVYQFIKKFLHEKYFKPDELIY